MKVVIYAACGKVQEVYCDDPTAEVLIFDEDDDLEPKGAFSKKEFFDSMREHTNGLTLRYSAD